MEGFLGDSQVEQLVRREEEKPQSPCLSGNIFRSYLAGNVVSLSDMKERKMLYFIFQTKKCDNAYSTIRFTTDGKRTRGIVQGTIE